MSSEGFVDMDDERDYHAFVSSLMVDKETHFPDAVRCLRIVRSVLPFDHVVDFGCRISAGMAAAWKSGNIHNRLSTRRFVEADVRRQLLHLEGSN
jgi:hypothetical protein